MSEIPHPNSMLRPLYVLDSINSLILRLFRINVNVLTGTLRRRYLWGLSGMARFRSHPHWRE